MSLSVLSVASEAWPLIKTGGLADVAGALPAAVAPHGITMTTLLPGYPSVMRALGKVSKKAVRHRYAALMGHSARLLEGQMGEHRLLVLDCPALFERDGGPYGDAQGRDWPDNSLRFAAFARAGADLASGVVSGEQFDILHGHDWQAGLAPAYLHFSPGPGPVARSMMTVHNIAFQGWFPPSTFPDLGLPDTAWSIDGVEFHGGVSTLKAGLQFAHRITTVSPSYAQEIRTPEFGMGFEGLVRARGADVRGIVNGIDTGEWNPANDPHLASPFDTRRLNDRSGNKRAVETAFGLKPGKGPLFIVVSRLTWQKGMDVLLEVLDHLVGSGGRLALLGSGDSALENALHAAAARHPGQVGVRIGYDESLSHLMQGGGDAILVPSRFEPCGLTQLYGLRYGCVPVVARTGGLADTIIDANAAALGAGVATGIQFGSVNADALTGAISRAVELFGSPNLWRTLQKRGMGADVSWARSGAAYSDLYRELGPAS
jgi:starch synthase